jgi:hypothetical protein
MNQIRRFKEYKDEVGELRGDEYEGIVALFQPNKVGMIKIGDKIIPSNELAAPIVIQMDHVLNKNAFCLYSLNSSGFDSISAETLTEFKRTVEIHEACFGLGNYCVAILNAQEFIKRCQIAIKKVGLSGNLGLVKYFNERNFHGYLPEKYHGYQKRGIFEHQREYRVLIDTEKPNPDHFILEIGDLTDIIQLTTPKEFNEQLSFKLPQ